MFPDNPLLQLTLPRVNRAVSRLQLLVWTEVAPVAVSFAGAEASPKAWETAKTLSYAPVELPFHWGKLFDVGWFKLELPKVATKEPLYLHWNDQGEGTMYIEGVPYYGFEVAHRYCALPAHPGDIYIESLCLQSAIWHPTATGLDPLGSKLSKAALFTRNELAWECLHDLRVLQEIALDEYRANYPTQPPKIGGGGGVGYHQPVDIVSPLYRRLLRTLDDAVNAFDAGGLSALKEHLAAAYKKFGGQGDTIHAVLTGHAHIDLVWLWPERTAEYKATHTFSTMNRLMELYPEFVFGYSQPASYDAVERISPKLMDAGEEAHSLGQVGGAGRDRGRVRYADGVRRGAGAEFPARAKGLPAPAGQTLARAVDSRRVRLLRIAAADHAADRRRLLFHDEADLVQHQSLPLQQLCLEGHRRLGSDRPRHAGERLIT